MKKNIIFIIVIICLLISNGYFIWKDYSSQKEIEVILPSGDEIEYEEPSGEAEIIKEKIEEVVVKEEISEDDKDKALEIYKEYDVIVFYAEPEGISAAISAARNDKKILLVEKRDGPGGLMTYGMLNTIDMNYNFDKTLLSKGIFEEFFDKIERRVSFDVNTAKKAFEEMLDNEENIDVLYDVKEIRIGSDGSTIEYAIIDDKKYVASMYIDCSQDADITAAAGGEYVEGWEDINEKNRAMSATLIIAMKDVDWDKCCEAVKKENIPNTGYTSDSIWAFADRTKNYIPKQPHMKLKGLNIGLQNDKTVLINSLQIINVNMLDNNAKEKAYEKCVKEAENVAKFLSENIPGFENATLAYVAPEFYIRETRHIVGENRLTVKDILESTYSYNAIAMASYPIDVQTTSIYDWGYIIGAPDQYYISMGTVIPKGFTNLMTIGRSGSYTSIAAGSARVIPTGMTLAESAGVIAAVCVERGIDLQKLLNESLIKRDVINRIKMQGVYLEKESKPVIDVNGRYYDFIIEMCELGILSLGYDNKFNPDDYLSEREFIILTKTYLKRNFLSEDFWNTDHINLLDATEGNITANRAKEILYDITTFSIEDETMKEKIENYINTVAPMGNDYLSTVRVYEILRYFKNFLIKNV